MKKLSRDEALGRILAGIQDVEIMTFWYSVIAQTGFIWVEDDSIPTAATDMESIYFNVRFWDSLDDKLRTFIILHEAFHIVRKESYRKADKNGYLWNIASDIVINDQLIELIDYLNVNAVNWHGMEAPDSALSSLRPQFRKYHGWVTEDIYKDLKERAEKNDGAWQGELLTGEGDYFEDVLSAGNEKAGGTQAGQQALERKLAVARIHHEEAMRNRLYDHTPSWFSDLVLNVSKPQVNWREVLQNFILSGTETKPSWSRIHIPSFVSTSCCLPTLYDVPSIDHVVVLTDSSSSVKEDEIIAFWNEIIGIAQHIKKLSIIPFTTTIEKIDTYDMRFLPNPKTLLPKARYEGGTDIPKVIEQVLAKNESGELPDWSALIILSDMISDPVEESLSRQMLAKGMQETTLWVSTTNLEHVEYIWEYAKHKIALIV